MRRKKIVWLCTYTNEEKRSHLRLWRNRPINYGLWIPDLLRAFEENPEYEIHVVTTQSWMRRRYESWKQRGITYHCFQGGVPFAGCVYPSFFPVDDWFRYRANTRRIQRIVKTIQPDIVHLFGAENAYYASSILELKKEYPALVTIQGFVHREKQYHGNATRFNVWCEQEAEILSSCQYFTGEYDSEQVVRKFNKDCSFFHMYFPINEALVETVNQETFELKYDLLFLGRVCKQKGIDDFLEIVRLLKARNPQVRAAIAGNGANVPKLQEQARQLGVEEQVTILGMLPTQRDVYAAFKQSKLFLVPTYNDAFATTIRESMMLGTPVLSYRTGGIPYANRDGQENILLFEQGDFKGMAEGAYIMLTQDEERRALAQRARAFAATEFSLQHNAEVIQKAYEALLVTQ